MPGSYFVHPDETFKTQGAKVPLHFERNEAGFCAGDRIGTQKFIPKDFETVDANCFQTKIEGSGFASGLNPRFDQPQIFIKDGVLKRNRQREDTVQPTLDVRQVISQPAIGI